VTKFCLTIPQIQKLLKGAKPNLWDYMLLRLELVTALRPSELFMLRWRCLDAEQKLLRIEETIYKGEVRRFTKTTAEGATEHTTVFLPNAIVKNFCTGVRRRSSLKTTI
jgi:integrase